VAIADVTLGVCIEHLMRRRRRRRRILTRYVAEF
jgi:hypothetical protein